MTHTDQDEFVSSLREAAERLAVAAGAPASPSPPSPKAESLWNNRALARAIMRRGFPDAVDAFSKSIPVAPKGLGYVIVLSEEPGAQHGLSTTVLSNVAIPERLDIISRVAEKLSGSFGLGGGAPAALFRQTAERIQTYSATRRRSKTPETARCHPRGT